MKPESHRIARLTLAPLLLCIAGFAQAAAGAAPLLPRFPDFGQLPPPGSYQSRIFKLSQDYPTEKPEIEPAVQNILQIDFTKDWKKYMEAVRDYIYEGNTEAEGVANDFYLEDNKVRHWYHVPWQHFGPFGREGIHGLTKEGPVNPFTLSPSQPNKWQTYAVGFYNPLGGYMIGKVWKDAENPTTSVMQSEGFPIGTVVGKVLFTTAPVAEAPFLTNPIEWLAYTTDSFASSKRVMSTVRFIQMDIMVRDPRANATGGWVFGTFVYNGALANPNLWLNAVPVGIMWGNDPEVTSYSDSNPQPTKTIINPDLKHTIINTSPDLPPMHLGWGLRLNGPVDNSMSSCQSCHSTAQFPQITAIMPSFATKDNGQPITPKDPEWLRWFRDVPCATPFDAQATSMDYSLQLAASIQNFLTAKSAATGGLYNVQYWNGFPVKQIYGQRGALPENQ